MVASRTITPGVKAEMCAAHTYADICVGRSGLVPTSFGAAHAAMCSSFRRLSLYSDMHMLHDVYVDGNDDGVVFYSDVVTPASYMLHTSQRM